jgi:ankyrin repeat protein
MKPLFVFAASAGLLSAQITSLQMLHRAEVAGDLKTVESLLSAGLDANVTDHNGQTPLSVAMISGEPRLIDLLLLWHADPNAPLRGASRQSQTPLQYAVEHQNLHAARALIDAGAHLNDLGGAGRAPLHYAVMHLDMMHLLLEKGANVNIRDSEGASPLDDAVWNGNLDAAAILLAHGARLNEPDTQTGATPLNEAAFRGHTELVRYLLQLNPDVTTADKRGRTALDNAVLLKKEDTALILLEAQPATLRTLQFLDKTMQEAIGTDESRVAEALLPMGANVEAALPSGYTPLDAAAFGGATKTASVLLEHGAKPNAAGKDGTTPLEDAAAKGFDVMAAMLIDRGARVNQTNADTGTTPLYAAASSEHLSTVKLLLERGANPSACGANRKTPYQAAVENGQADIAGEIKSRGGAERCR